MIQSHRTWLVLLSMILGIVGGSRAETFSDDFTGADLSRNYKVLSGDWSVIGEALKAEGRGNKILLFPGHEPAGGDFTMAVDFKLENPGEDRCAVGLIFNYEGEGNYCVARFSGGGTNALQLIRIVDRQRGEKKDPDEKGKDIQKKCKIDDEVLPETWYRLTVNGHVGGRYEFSLQQREAGEILAKGSSGNADFGGRGKVGFYVSGPARAVFDNFVLEWF